MRAVVLMLVALRFFADLLGVGRMDCGVGRWRRGVLSESLRTSANARLTGVLLALTTTHSLGRGRHVAAGFRGVPRQMKRRRWTSAQREVKA